MSRQGKPAMDEDNIRELLQKVGARPAPPADVEARIKEKVAAAWREEVKRRQQRTWTRYALAASVVMALTLTWMVVPTGQEMVPIAEVAHIVGNAEVQDADGNWQLLVPGTRLGTQSLRTGADSFVALATEGGLSLRIADNSEVQLASDNCVSLVKGALYADTANRKGNEITVNTPFGQARDIGTRFEVRLSDDSWHVQVRDGVVEVKDDGILEHTGAGDRLTISRTNLVAKETVSSDDPSWQWAAVAAVPFRIEGASLHDYLGWVAHETGARLNFASDSVEAQAKRTILHGSINGLSPQDSLTAVLATTNFQASSVTAGVLMIERPSE
ncbi:MAG: FecR domain-containing protein [Pseudomonadota bacterium]